MDDQTPMAMELDFTGPFSANELVAFGDLSIPLEEIAAGATGRATYAFTLPRTQRSSADLVVDLDGVHALATLEGVAR